MKRLVLLFMMLVGCLSLNAQSVTMTNSGDTIVDTGSKYLILKVNNKASNVAFQAVVTKVSGTVAGTVLLQGSIDGVNYKDISTDTLNLTDVATQSYLWTVSANPYLYYRLAGTGSGTMSAILTGYAIRRD